jgi:hypothetical protein
MIENKHLNFASKVLDAVRLSTENAAFRSLSNHFQANAE